MGETQIHRIEPKSTERFGVCWGLHEEWVDKLIAGCWCRDPGLEHVVVNPWSLEMTGDMRMSLSTFLSLFRY